MKMQPLVLALGLSLSAITVHAAVDAGVPTYTKTSGISGNLSSVGSDTLANLMTFWAEDFKKQYPNVNVQIQAAGSSTAPPALTQGTSNFGPMSRAMKDKGAGGAAPGRGPQGVPAKTSAKRAAKAARNPAPSVDRAPRSPIQALKASVKKAAAKSKSRKSRR